MAKSFRSSLRQFILAACECDQYVKLENPVGIHYLEPGIYDCVKNEMPMYDRVAMITEVGRFRKATKLVEKFGNIFSLNDATEKECEEILSQLNTRCPEVYTYKSK